MTNKSTDAYLGKLARDNAIQQGRSEMDCTHGEFSMPKFIYEDQFGPERPDYNLDD